MNVTLRQLKVFEAVARHLSFTRAAEELFLTQPAVSMQVKQLESHAGLPMFEQVGKKVSLTEAGREMQFYSRAIMQLLDEADDVLTCWRPSASAIRRSPSASISPTARDCCAASS